MKCQEQSQKKSMKVPFSSVKGAKARKGSLTPKGSGGGARCARVPDEGKDCRPGLVLAPSIDKGKLVCQVMNAPFGKVAICTEPEHLKDVLLYPDEVVHVVMGIDPEFFRYLQRGASMFCPGEHFEVKLYAL